MEDSQKIPFINQEFENNIKTIWLDSRNDKYFSDVNLSCAGKQIQSHKLVLSANSHVFKDLLKQIPHDHPNPLLYLRGIAYSDLVSMLDYMYFGEITVNENNLDNFVALLKEFEIAGFESNVKILSQNDELHTVGGCIQSEEIKNKVQLQIEVQEQNFNFNNETYLNEESTTTLPPSPKQETDFVMEEIEGERLNLSECLPQSDQEDFVVANYENSEEGTIDSKSLVEEESKNLMTNIKDVMRQLSCDQCDYTTKRNTLLQLHKQSRHEGIRYFCPKCEFRFIKKTTLNEHILAKHEGICYPCNECDYKANRKGDLRSHKRSLHEGIRFPCQLCEYIAPLKSGLKWHILKKHDSTRYSCELCTYKTESCGNLVTHCDSEHEGFKHLCSKCEFKSKKKSDLNEHILSKHEGIRHPCNECDYKGKRKTDLQVHKRTWHIQDMHDSTFYSCELCTYKVPESHDCFRKSVNASDLILKLEPRDENCDSNESNYFHETDFNKDIETKEVSDSQIPFDDQTDYGNQIKTEMVGSEFENEMKYYDELDEKIVEMERNQDLSKGACEFCGKYMLKRNFKRHIENHHVRPNTKPKVQPKTKIKECTICKQNIKSTNLARHMKDVHAKKRLICELCGKSYSDSQSLKRHTETCSIVKMKTKP